MARKKLEPQPDLFEGKDYAVTWDATTLIFDQPMWSQNMPTLQPWRFGKKSFDTLEQAIDGCFELGQTFLKNVVFEILRPTMTVVLSKPLGDSVLEGDVYSFKPKNFSKTEAIEEFKGSDVGNCIYFLNFHMHADTNPFSWAMCCLYGRKEILNYQESDSFKSLHQTLTCLGGATAKVGGLVVQGDKPPRKPRKKKS